MSQTFNNGSQGSKRRLVQILSILKKHQITKGIDPVKFREILEDLGPTFVKIGQIMSSRQDMFSERYCKELVKLRDNVGPMDMETVKEIIESEYGSSLSDIFREFDHEPLGSASIAQVHKAILHDGQEIVVKVQRPNIYEMMERDIMLVRRASRILHLNDVLGGVVDIDIVMDEFWQTAKEEMDFLNEAKNAQYFASLHKETRYIDCPEILLDYSTSKILVMEYIEGLEITDSYGLLQQGYDCKEIAIKLADNYIKQIVDDGFFHADPHPGNLRIRDGKIVWIDFGMMGILSSEDKELMKKAVIAIGNNDATQLVDVILTLGVHDGKIDYSRFYTDIETLMRKYLGMHLSDINLGNAIQEIFSIAHLHKISMPKGISMLARGLVTIESTMTDVCPDINIITIAANHVSSYIIQKFDVRNALEESSKSLYDIIQHSSKIPIRLSDFMDMLLKGRVKINLDIMDSSEPLNTINHMVNKLIVGIISAGLLMASSLLCTTNMTPRVLDIPAIGFIGYLTAVGLGLWLLFTVLKERHKRKRKGRKNI